MYEDTPKAEKGKEKSEAQKAADRNEKEEKDEAERRRLFAKVSLSSFPFFLLGR